jgi:SAM-dependent methyltransferase
MINLLRHTFRYMTRVIGTSASRYSYNRRLPAILAEMHLDMRGKRVLDAGCGDGRYSSLFDGANYTGIDIGKYDFKRGLIGNAGFCRARVDEPPFENDTFDFVISSFMLEHVADVPGVLASIRSLLKPGGGMMLSTGTKWARPVGEMHHLFWRKQDESVGQAHHYFDLQELVKLHREAGFENVSVQLVGGPIAISIEVVIVFFRLLMMKIRGRRYTHRRDSDETGKAVQVRRNSIGHLVWKVLVPLQFCIRWTLYEFSYWVDRALLPLRCAQFVVIKAK